MSLRLAGIAVVGAATAAAFAVPANAETINAQAKAQVVKPLTLSAIQNLDLGTLLLGPGSWSGATVSLSRSGSLTCPANVTCSGAAMVARYNVAGSNKQTVIIHAPNVTLVNQSDSTKTLTLVVDSPGSVYLPNSGAPGTNFNLGGSLTLNSTTAAGTYVGTFNVSVEYQ
ncbi:MAG: DUF4402 domain-containing protein [Alphaproteobacteria bacterium]